jgi:hypothetical protein
MVSGGEETAFIEALGTFVKGTRGTSQDLPAQVPKFA